MKLTGLSFVLSALVAAISAQAAYAAQVRITPGNINQFSYIGTAEHYACRTAGDKKQLGTLNSASLAVGAKWESLNVAKARSGYRKEAAKLQAKIRKTKKAKQRAQLEKQLLKINAALNALDSSNAECLAGGAAPTPAPTPTPTPDPTPAPTPPDGIASYKVYGSSFTGHVAADAATVVTLGNDKWMKSVRAANGSFNFDSIPPGKYFLRAEGQGLDFGRSAVVTVEASSNPSAPQIAFSGVRRGNGSFRYHWEEEQESRAGYEYSAYVNTPPNIVYLDQQLHTVDASAADKLRAEYKIYLSDEAQPWDEERADRLLKTVESLPVVKSGLSHSKWILTADEIDGDITIVSGDVGKTVTITDSAFTYATPKIVEIDGVKGSYFSKRLHHAIAYYLTAGGTDFAAVEKILGDRFGVTTTVPNYTVLTAATTAEHANSFQQFYPQELLQIINMFEETPEGFHRTPGLRYLVRRKDGMTNPRTPSAPAIAWQISIDGGYIEFMDFAFSRVNIDSTHRLILHEKAHYLWYWYYPESLKQEWIQLGEWFQPDPAGRPNDWETTLETEFVSSYAHAHNPDEDMAESLAYYVVNPEWLMSRSPRKFDFVKQRIMHGDRYYSRIREDLTFEVYNLYPDYVYPGKIKRVDITVAGAPEQDKAVTVELELQTNDLQFEGATYAFTRIQSEADPYVDLYLYPVNPNANGIGTVLRGTFNLSKFAKNGFWKAGSIDIYDAVGNARYQSPSTFGWKMYVDNSLEDLIDPAYVDGTLRLEKTEQVIEGHLVTIVDVTWQVAENKEMRSLWPVHAALSNVDSTQGAMGEWGTFDQATSTARVRFYVTEYKTAGDYGVPEIDMIDIAGNSAKVRFHAEPLPDQLPLSTIWVDAANTDDVRPELDVNQITVHAEPLHPEAPTGETLVTISFYARDDKSGVGNIAYRLRDPQGGSHHFYHTHENFYTMFFQGDPTVWKLYTMHTLLPPGSAPGTWGLQEVVLKDKAENYQSYNFLETMHFVVSGN